MTVSSHLRERIRQQAQNRCGYCLAHQDYVLGWLEIEHIIPTGVGGTDVNYRYGVSLFSPKTPFVPGYEMMGIVEAVGDGVTKVAVGDCVAALIGHGGYTEIIYITEEHLVPVSPSIDPAEVVAVVLNYVTAYQMLHRVAKVKPGDRVLINGASGGVGTALLE